MYVIQNFSSQAIGSITPFDKLVWLIGLIKYKSFGYKIKLYCEEKDIQFLKDNFLYSHYDEIDTVTLSNCEWLTDNINQKAFWFFRKIVALENEFKLGNEFFYSDTDIILNSKPLFDNCDIYLWSKEKSNNIYCNWEDFSAPPGYIRPSYLNNINSNIFNCGVLYIKDKNFFQLWKEEMLKFARNNPCELYNKEIASLDSVFACNCEQRILTGLVIHHQLKVEVFDNNPEANGVSAGGAHFYFWRYHWRTMKKRQDDAKNDQMLSNRVEEFNWAYILYLKRFTDVFLKQLVENCMIDEYKYFMSMKEIKELYMIDVIYNDLIKKYQ